MSLAVVLVGRDTSWRLARQIAIVVTAATMLALSSRLVQPAPSSPVPVTAQTLAVILCGALLGAETGVASVGLFLAAGATGLPVFSAGGGAAYLLGPTGGFLLGFVPGCWIMGKLVERGWAKGPLRLALAILLALAMIYGLGLLVLSMYVPAARLLQAGLLPFLPGEAVKMLLAAIVIRKIRPSM